MHDNYCRCNQCCSRDGISDAQRMTNTQITIPVAPLTDYELALQTGLIDPDTTLEEWLMRPTENAFNIVEYGDNV